jgi:solute carrier family 34 (sodium-dependent phosphate cotransporter)
VIVLFPLQITTNVLGKVAMFLTEVFQNIGGVKYASPVKIIVKPAVNIIGNLVGDHPLIVLLIAVILLFISLKYLTVLIRSLVMVRLEAFFDRYIFKTALRAFGFGLALTVLVQSSSIATSLVIPLAGAGLLTLVQIYPYTLGSNIGTTVTALLASLVSGSTAPIAVAFSHLMFNVLGIAVIWPIPAIRHIPLRLAEFMAEMAIRNRMIPFFYVIITFFVIPLLVITIFQL